MTKKFPILASLLAKYLHQYINRHKDISCAVFGNGGNWKQPKCLSLEES